MADIDLVDAEILRLLLECDLEKHEIVGVSQIRKGRVEASELEWRLRKLTTGNMVKEAWDRATDRPFYSITNEGRAASAGYESRGRGYAHPELFWIGMLFVLGLSVVIAQRSIMGEHWLKSAGTIALQAFVIVVTVYGPGKAR